MYGFFLVLVVLHVAGALFSITFGYGGGALAGRHMTIGLITALWALLMHCLFLFFFTGTGSWVRKNVPDDVSQKADWMARVAGFRKRFFPTLLLSILLWMGTATAGGAASVLLIPAWAHGLIAVGTSLHSFWTCRLGLRLVRENLTMLRGVERALSEGGAA